MGLQRFFRSITDKVQNVFHQAAEFADVDVGGGGVVKMFKFVRGVSKRVEFFELVQVDAKSRRSGGLTFALLFDKTAEHCSRRKVRLERDATVTLQNGRRGAEASRLRRENLDTRLKTKRGVSA